MKIEQAKQCGKFQGRKELIQHLEGKKLTFRKMCLAKCFECMGGYNDGAVDCQIPDCPLYPKMPYHTKKAAVSTEAKEFDATAKKYDPKTPTEQDCPEPSKTMPVA